MLVSTSFKCNVTNYETNGNFHAVVDFQPVPFLIIAHIRGCCILITILYCCKYNYQQHMKKDIIRYY